MFPSWDSLYVSESTLLKQRRIDSEDIDVFHGIQWKTGQPALRKGWNLDSSKTSAAEDDKPLFQSSEIDVIQLPTPFSCVSQFKC